MKRRLLEKFAGIFWISGDALRIIFTKASTLYLNRFRLNVKTDISVKGMYLYSKTYRLQIHPELVSNVFDSFEEVH